MEAEIMQLAKIFKESENYGDELNISKLEETDNYNVGTEE